MGNFHINKKNPHSKPKRTNCTVGGVLLVFLTGVKIRIENTYLGQN